MKAGHTERGRVTLRSSIQGHRSRIVLVFAKDEPTFPVGEISHHLPLLLMASCGCDPALIDEKNGTEWGGEDGLLFLVRAELRKTHRYIH